MSGRSAYVRKEKAKVRDGKEMEGDPSLSDTPKKRKWSPPPSHPFQQDVLPSASSETPHDFVLFENAERREPPTDDPRAGRDLFTFTGKLMSAADDTVQIPNPGAIRVTSFGRFLPPVESKDDLRKDTFKGSFVRSNDSSKKVKRRSSESDIRTEENKTALPEPRTGSHGSPRNPTINKVVAAAGYSAFTAMTGSSIKENSSANRYFHSAYDPDTKINDGLDDEDDDEDDWQELPPPEENQPIVPNYEGFRTHIRRLYPDMESRCKWLVSRIAHQQELRYRNLLDMTVKHRHAIGRNECAAGWHCFALGGSVTNLNDKPYMADKDSDTSELEGVLTGETFPANVPMPPTRTLPAEFECQICFKAKKFQKPSDWTKHVHEDVQPFTCTFENCKEPKCFKRKADWVRHENERHRHLEWWTCQVDDCTHPSYRKDNFLQHLVREHKFPEPKQMTKAAIKKARLTEPAWIMLEQCHHETTKTSQDEPCKFCSKTFMTWKKLTVHLAKHMEHIALPILRLVEASNVDANTIVSPVENILSPHFPATQLTAKTESLLLDGFTKGSQKSTYHNSAFDFATDTAKEDWSIYGTSKLSAHDTGTTISPASQALDRDRSLSDRLMYGPSIPENYNSVPTIPENESLSKRFGDIGDPMDIDSVLGPKNDDQSATATYGDSEYSKYQTTEFSDTEDPFFGVNFDAGVGRIDSGLSTFGFHAADLNRPLPDLPNTVLTNALGSQGTLPGPSSANAPIIYPAEFPSKEQSMWSLEEDTLIIRLKDGGMKWEDISKRLPGRSTISCRFRYYQVKGSLELKSDRPDDFGRWTCFYCNTPYSSGKSCLNCGLQSAFSFQATQEIPLEPSSKFQQDSIEVKKQELSHDWDVQSLASLNTFNDSALGSSLPSNISGSITQGLPKTAQEEILLILFSDHQFRALLESAASLISKPRFTRNVRRLLIPFQQELHSAATDHREKDATRIIERHSPWLASRLFDMSDPENKSNSHNMATHLSQHIDKRLMLERYLAGTTSSTVLSSIPATNPSNSAKVTKPSGESPNQSSREATKTTHSPSQSPESSDESDESGSDASEMDIENYIDYSQFPNLEHIKNFIIGGTAFENLKQSTFQFLNPQKPIISSPKRSPEMPSEDSFENPGSTATTEVTIPDFELEEDSDDAASIASDDPALTGASENRILNPREYFDKLENLEREVFEDSAFLFSEISASPGESQHTRALLSSDERYHFRTMIDNVDVIALVKLSSSRRLLHLLECYNIICRTGKSLARLQTSGYLVDALTLLAMERDYCRRRVAKMVQVPVQVILNLGLTFEVALKSVLSELATSHGGQDSPDIVDSIVQRQAESHGLTALCEEMLDSMNITLPRADNNRIWPLPETRPISWDCAVQTLQLGVLSYAGAHIQRFDMDLIGFHVADFQLPTRIYYQDEVLQGISSRPVDVSVRLRRRKFQCLDKLLRGCQPWVFHENMFNMGDEPLCLSTTIGALTDVWGPSWKILGERGTIPRYDIGNGFIVPWYESPEQYSIHADTIASEIYCHWISSKEWNAELVESNQSRLPRKLLLESDVLLIGANTEFGLNINPECSSSPERLSRLKTQLHDQGALTIPRTYRDKRYIDSHAVQLTGTALGIISGSGTVTYKRRVGHTMKDALVERWRHNLRSPLDLEAFSGVEVSFCTKNARRRRLMHLLSSDTMRNYLSTISFNWVSEACEHAYFKALRCPKTFRRFWKDHKEWQENVGNAISICLDALEETGIDEDSGELSALWVESFDEQGESDGESDGEEDKEDEEDSPPRALICQATTLGKQMDSRFCEEHIVTLFRSEHTWTGFLHDSEESLTMAIVGMTCLDFLHETGYGRRCVGQRGLLNTTSTSNGFAVLQTSLKLNESILKSEKLKQEKVDSGRKIIWDAKELKRGTAFALGNHGTLKVVTAATRTCPTVAEWSGVKSEILKEVKNVAVNEKMLGRPGERHHCEYIRGSWEAKPLPVLVMSRSTKVIFTKG